MKTILVVTILLSGAMAAASNKQPSEVNLAADSLTFCMSGSCNALPDTSVFSDGTNNAIGKACIHNVHISQLRKIDGIDDRLKRLVKANAVELRNGKCSLTFPVIDGLRRGRITAISGEAAVKLRPTVLAIIKQLQSAIPDRPELTFHLLWSRVIDDEIVWQEAWRAAFGPSALPDVTWAISPPHSFTVGTYSYPLSKTDWFAFTTVSNSWQYKNALVELAPQLDRLAWNAEVKPDAEQRLKEFGLVDSRESFHVFTYRSGDHFDQLIQQLTSEYATALADVYDYIALAKSFGVPPKHMFCMLLHETAYALLDDLRRQGDLDVPTVLTGKDVVQLVSIKTAASQQ